MNKELLMKLALFGSHLLYAYSLLIWVRIICSWFSRIPDRSSFVYYMGKMVDPYLNLFRGKKTSVIGRLDFSPIFAVGVVFIFQSVLNIYGTSGMLTLAAILQIFIYAFWSYGLSIYFWVLFFALVFKVIASFSSNSALWNAAGQMGMAAQPVTDFIRSFARNRILSEKLVNVLSLVLTIVLYFICRYLVTWLMGTVAGLPF